MRYVLLAVALLATSIVWLNTSVQGHRIKRQMMEHPEEPAKLY
jgi:hypothetical protein